MPGDPHLDADEHRKRNERPPDPILHVEPSRVWTYHITIVKGTTSATAATVS